MPPDLQKVRANTSKLIKAGAFNDKSNDGNTTMTITRTSGRGNPTKQKRGTTNTVVQEEDK